MGLIDAAIVLAALAVMVVFYRHRHAIQTLRLNVAVGWIVLGLSVMALHYASDLAIMLVLPALTSPEVAMAAMTDLHLNWSWPISLIEAACIAFGLFGLLSRLLPGISESITQLRVELEARRAAEAALRISEARFRDITEASSDWFWEMDENLRFSYYSEGYGDIVGSLQDTLLGTTRQETDVPGVDPEAWEAHLADLAAHRSFRDFHITRARPDGSPVYLSINGKAIFDEAGNFLGYRGAGTDVTDRKRVERRLIESEGRLQSFIKNSPGAVSIKSVEGRYLLVNPVFENIFGMTSDAILGKRAEDLVGPSFAASSEAHDRAVIDSGEVVEREESLDLGRRALELFTVKFPLRDDRGAITAVGAIQIDITERKRAEKALRHAHDELEERVEARTAELRESEQSLANAQRIAHVGNWEWNIVTGDLHWSDEIYRIFGLGPREFGATYEAFLEAVHPDDRTRVTTAVNQAIASHEPYSIEHRLLRPDGAVRFVHERGEVIYDDDDQPVHMSGTVQDITERKLIEEEVRRLNEHLEALVEERTLELRDAQADLVRKERLAALGQLTASVSHELRNPLGALRTAVAVMKRINHDDPLLVESAGIADRSIDRCDAIITDLLDFTRLRSLRLTPIWLDQWLDGLLDEYRLPEGIELRREFASGVEVHFDPERVRRILLNLLDNATQAMTGDERASRAAAGGHVLTVASRMGIRRFEVVVGDTGPGIPPEISGDIFEPLFSTKNFGVGLGLPIVLQIAKQHGGGVEVSRAPAGGGAEFTLWLPTEAPELREAS